MFDLSWEKLLMPLTSWIVKALETKKKKKRHFVCETNSAIFFSFSSSLCVYRACIREVISQTCCRAFCLHYYVFQNHLAIPSV